MTLKRAITTLCIVICMALIALAPWLVLKIWVGDQWEVEILSAEHKELKHKEIDILKVKMSYDFMWITWKTEEITVIRRSDWYEMKDGNPINMPWQKTKALRKEWEEKYGECDKLEEEKKSEIKEILEKGE